MGGCNIKLIKGDTLKELPKLKDNSVNHVITSPPYNMNLRVRNNKYVSRQIVKELSSKYEGFSDNLTMDQYFDFTKTILTECLRITSGYVFYNIQLITGNKRALYKIIGEFNENIKEMIIWNKGHAQPAIASGVMNSQYELILVLTSDANNAMQRQFKDANFKRGTLTNVWDIKRGRSKIKGHSAVFPDQLVEKIITNFTKENDIILDPFMGTGVTGVVSKRLIRNFVGIELLDQYFDFAEEQIKKSGGESDE